MTRSDAPLTPLPARASRDYHDRMQHSAGATTQDMGMGPPSRVAVR
jgi:hypothetical protein